MTVEQTPFLSLRIPPHLAARWPAPRRCERSPGEAAEGVSLERPTETSEAALPISGWPRVFPGL